MITKKHLEDVIRVVFNQPQIEPTERVVTLVTARGGLAHQHLEQLWNLTREGILKQGLLNQGIWHQLRRSSNTLAPLTKEEIEKIIIK